MVDSERAWRGGQRQIGLLMAGLRDAAVEVALWAPGDGELYRRAASLVGVRRAWTPGWRGVAALRRALRAGGFDVVHSHASRAHGAVALAGVGLLHKPPHVVSRRTAFAIGRGPAGAWKYRRGADAYAAISQHVARALVDAGVVPERVRVVPSGVDLERLARRRDRAAVRRELGVGDDVRVVGTVAALTAEKDVGGFVQAAVSVRARVRETRFVVVGDGPLRASLAAQARALGVEGDVVFTGFRDDALDLLHAFDVFVLSSYAEGLGTSIMDAHALGVPVVATRTGGIPELVEDGVTGLVVAPREPAALAGAIVRFLGDAGLRAACAREGKARSARYDYRAMVYKTLDLYRELCEKRVAPLGPSRSRSEGTAG
jgi:glycosyltransferase involved in cell wall biosynthesis